MAIEASQVTPRIWEEKCQEEREANESSKYWKNQLEVLHQDSPIWMKERENVIEDYESFKRTIDFLQKDRDEYRAELNGLIELCNCSAKDMPWKLRDAMEEFDRDNTHPTMVSFILLCKEMLRRFKEELEELKAQKHAV